MWSTMRLHAADQYRRQGLDRGCESCGDRARRASCRHFTMLLPTTIDGTNEVFRANDAHNRSLAATLCSTIAATARGGPAKHRERQVERGKLLPRRQLRH